MIALVLVVAAVCIMWLVFAHDHAPYGYQDEAGFHYGRPSPRLRMQPEEERVPGALGGVTEPKGSRLSERTLP